MSFNTEREFESALIELLSSNYLWEKEVLVNPTEQDLIDNWASILFANNRGIDSLGDYPLTNSEMAQIIEQITALKTPLKLNGFINGKAVRIKRDNTLDTHNFGKDVYLKIYDRMEIAAGQSRYQIARQPQFPTSSRILPDRRGDVMLLINGMPVFHIELKKSGVPVSQATNQIEKYSRAGIFSGLFALVQIFVAMNPEEALYFANPGEGGRFNPDFYFHWADYNNMPINDFREVAARLLSIPMAHQLIGFYTVADDGDGILKVLRSYQYYAASAISDKVATTKWKDNNQRGGYIWHTTGSGKTLTSFKAAQLISQSRDADKVVFLIDRIELGTQSLKEYKGFAEGNEEIQATENGSALRAKLKSDSALDTLIITSIQKMSRIQEDGDLKAGDLAKMRGKRIIFIVDECHRSTFGEMMIAIKDTFPSAVFFGFTGTPIHEENQKKGSTTADIFGDELHRYSIADGIRDKNVLGFDPYLVQIGTEHDIRKAVALHEANASSEAEAIADPAKSAVYYKFMNASTVRMAGGFDNTGKYIKGIEDYIPTSQYETELHQISVVNDIVNRWITLSRNGKFHALFATSSIPEAIDYYRLLKRAMPTHKISALFDPSIDDAGDPRRAALKEAGLIEIAEDYMRLFKVDLLTKNKDTSKGGKFSFDKFKKDVAMRLAHKEVYKFIERTPELQLDLLIVVDQMLTGFDSKWVNTLYLDKLLRDANIIQAFSRTNRLFGHEKPFGTIRYYRKPHTMKRNVDSAVKLYSGDKPLKLFASRLPENIESLNMIFDEICTVFVASGVVNFERLPAENAAKGRFAILFRGLNECLEAAKIQGFKWEYPHGQTDKAKVRLRFDEQTYLVLVLRYKELFLGGEGSGDGGSDVPFDITPYITEINTGAIDADYMNSHFEKFLKALDAGDAVAKAEALKELHSTFNRLTQDEQKYANIFLRDIERGDANVESGKTLRDYITELQAKAKADQIHRFAVTFGINEIILRKFMDLCVSEQNINDYGRFDKLLTSVDKAKAKAYFEKKENTSIPSFRIQIKIDTLLRQFVLAGGIDLDGE